MPDVNELFRKRVFNTLPGMENTIVKKDIPYSQGNLQCDIYTPPENQRSAKLPVVVLIHGEAPFHTMKDAGQFQSLGELIAASGMAAVAFNRRTLIGGAAITETLADIDSMIEYVGHNADALGIDPSRIALWSVSAGVPFGLYAGLLNKSGHIRCQVAYYGFGDFETLVKMLGSDRLLGQAEEFSPAKMLSKGPSGISPILIARAGLDNPLLNESLDRFVSKALANNLPVDIYNHPTGHHAFDLFDDNARSREIVGKTLEFLRSNLLQ